MRLVPSGESEVSAISKLSMRNFNPGCCVCGEGGGGSSVIKSDVEKFSKVLLLRSFNSGRGGGYFEVIKSAVNPTLFPQPVSHLVSRVRCGF